MTAEKSIWVLMNPDNNHWSEEEAYEVITYYASLHEIEVCEAGDTRDTGFGQERLFILDGSIENMERFESDIYEALQL